MKDALVSPVTIAACLTDIRVYSTMVAFREEPRADNKRAWRLPVHLPKGGVAMRITFHIGRYTVTIVIKETHRKENSRPTAK